MKMSLSLRQIWVTSTVSPLLHLTSALQTVLNHAAQINYWLWLDTYIYILDILQINKLFDSATYNTMKKCFLLILKLINILICKTLNYYKYTFWIALLSFTVFGWIAMGFFAVELFIIIYSSSLQKVLLSFL